MLSDTVHGQVGQYKQTKCHQIGLKRVHSYNNKWTLSSLSYVSMQLTGLEALSEINILKFEKVNSDVCSHSMPYTLQHAWHIITKHTILYFKYGLLCFANISLISAISRVLVLHFSASVCSSSCSSSSLLFSVLLC